MEIWESRVCGTGDLILKISGRIDLNASYDLEKVVTEAMAKYTIHTMTLDLEKVEYMSSAALRVILSAQKKLKGDKKLIIRNPSDFCQKIFSVTGADIFLQIETV